MLLRGGAHVVARWCDVVLQPTARRANGRAAWRGVLADGDEVWLRFSVTGKWFLAVGALDAASDLCNAQIACAAGDEGLPTGARVWKLGKAVRGVTDGETWVDGELTVVAGAAAAAAQVRQEKSGRDLREHESRFSVVRL